MKDEPPYSPAAAGAGGWLQIIGVVADARNDGLRNPIKSAFYVPVYAQDAHVHADPGAHARAAAVDPAGRSRRARSRRSRAAGHAREGPAGLDHESSRSTPSSSWSRGLFAIFSMLALALSAVGLYSVVSYGVATRTNEFGIRMALGARARDVVRMVLSGTSWTVGIGLIAGVRLVRDLRQARLVLGDGELARSADPCWRHRPSSGRRRRRVRGAGASRGVDRSHGRRAARMSGQLETGRRADELAGMIARTGTACLWLQARWWVLTGF